MRHMTHLGPLFGAKTTLESAQCDTVLAQCDVESGATAKKRAGAGI
jgi:hypothetical protein